MKRILLLLVLVNVFNSNAQVLDNLFAIVSKSNPDYSVTIRMGNVNPTSGVVDNAGLATSQIGFNVSGGSLNQSTNRFNLISDISMMSFDIFDGSIVNQLPINSFYSGLTFFTNVRYNNSNNTLYGLASTFTYENDFDGMFLAKLNTETGDLTAVSQNSVGTGYQLAGTAINPKEMVYYFSSGSKFMGIDLYNGTIYTNPDITFSNPNLYNFCNFTYNCSDDTIYGLVTEDTQIQNPNVPFPSTYTVLHFAKINPITGAVTLISEADLPSNSYSLNAGSTIDPNSSTYYYTDGLNVFGISLQTGSVVSNNPLSFEDGTNINMMTNYNNCIGAIATRMDPGLSNPKNNFEAKVVVFPNPTSNILHIESNAAIDAIKIFDTNGRTVKTKALNAATLDVEDLKSGVYFLKVVSNGLEENIKFVKL